MLELKQARQNGFHRMDDGVDINEEERKVLLALLREYSDKLSSICADIDHSIKSYQKGVALSYLGFIPLGLILVGIQTRHQSLQNTYPSILATLFLIIALILMNLNNPRNRKKFLVVYAKIIGIKLEKLIKNVVRLQEHFQSSYVNKLEVELRLADAESALAYYDAVIKQLEPQKNKAAKKPLVKD